jgi:hypothetical protein
MKKNKHSVSLGGSVKWVPILQSKWTAPIKMLSAATLEPAILPVKCILYLLGEDLHTRIFTIACL